MQGPQLKLLRLLHLSLNLNLNLNLNPEHEHHLKQDPESELGLQGVQLYVAAYTTSLGLHVQRTWA